MAQIINLPVGVSTFGNSTDADIVVDTLDVTGLVSLKTLSNGVWSSWTAGTPVDFQGFANIKKGIGYVANTNVTKALTFNGNDLDVNTITYGTGLSMIALPHDNRLLGDGYVPRIKLDSIKTIASNIWKSWTAGTPTQFQGFTATDKNKGYVVNISQVFHSFLNSNLQSMSEGIRFNTNDITLTNNTVTNGVRYTNPNNLGSLSFDAVVFDPTVPTAIMFFSIADKIAKIDFPIELLGEDFFVVYNGSTYNSKFVENENYATPTIITSVINNGTLELSYTKINGINALTATYHEMIVSLNGVNSVVEFANEYLDTTFNVWKDGKIGTGVFTKGTITITL